MRKQKNDGFTLIELLAVIIVLAIIALIATPIILGIIAEVRRAAFERSVEMSIKAFELYRASNEEIKRIEITNEKLPLNDNNFISGSLLSLSGGEIEAYKITDGEYCADGKIGELEVTKGACIGDTLDNFVINTYFLHVNPNGGMWNGTEEITEVPVENNSKINLVNPVKTGYAFTGWEMNVVGNIDDTDNGILTTEMVANWVGNTYKLVIDPDGGIYEESTENKIVDVVAGESIELKTPTREGYIFVEWEIIGQDSSIIKNLFTMGIENTTLTAKWQGEQYTVNYNCNGGEGSTESSVHTHGEASKLSVSNCFKVTQGTSGSIQYVSGWATSSDATVATYSAEELVTDIEATTLYAIYDNLFVYETGTYNVKNDGNGNWRVKLLTSGTFTSNANIKIDAFLVGGGGGGASGGAAGGGGGGHTTTETVTLTALQRYNVVIGGGGSGAGRDQGASAKAGGNTTAFDKIGYGGSPGTTSGGGAGGSGGGASGNTGGYNGNNGNGSAGGKGDGKTTCEFNQQISDGVCAYTDNEYDGFYSGGGGGRGQYKSGGKGGGGRGSDNDLGNPVGGVANTGGGGGGCHSNANGGAGGRGIVVIRNAKE